MATHIFGRDHAAWLRRRTAVVEQTGQEAPAASGGAFRGLFYAILFNAMVIAVVIGGWELWRHVR